jgi:hypothetical protein
MEASQQMDDFRRHGLVGWVHRPRALACVGGSVATHVGWRRRQREAGQHGGRGGHVRPGRAKSAAGLASDLPAVALRPVRFRGHDRGDLARHAPALQRARGPLRPVSACGCGAAAFRGRASDG